MQITWFELSTDIPNSFSRVPYVSCVKKMDPFWRKDRVLRSSDGNAMYLRKEAEVKEVDPHLAWEAGKICSEKQSTPFLDCNVSILSQHGEVRTKSAAPS